MPKYTCEDKTYQELDDEEDTFDESDEDGRDDEEEDW